MKYVAPQLNAEAFTCPFCHVLTTMIWDQLYGSRGSSYSPIRFRRCTCHHCSGESYWHIDRGTLIEPAVSNSPLPHPDLPDACRVDFEEARQILGASPRGAAALLRLCLQKLCTELGEDGNNINADIATLVAKGLPPMVQQALDVVRVTGNHAVHPGEMSLEDDPESAGVMFDMINFIVEDRISRPKAIQEHYARLPQRARDAIEKRDQPKS